MQEVRAHLRYLRMAPRKVRLVITAIRGLRVDVAERGLLFSKRHAARPVLKLLRSAIANAEHNHKLKRENLFVAEITANDGPTLRRYRPRAFGSAAMIRKRSSHVTIVLGEREKAASKPPKQKKTAEKTSRTVKAAPVEAATSRAAAHVTATE